MRRAGVLRRLYHVLRLFTEHLGKRRSIGMTPSNSSAQPTQNLSIKSFLQENKMSMKKKIPRREGRKSVHITRLNYISFLSGTIYLLVLENDFPICSLIKSV